MGKYTMHICRCLDLGHNEMFQFLVGELTTWLIETLGKHSIASTVKIYLLARSKTKLSSCVHGANVGLVTLSVQTNPSVGIVSWRVACPPTGYQWQPLFLTTVPIPATTCMGMPTYF
jgi:hypothetical protein